MNAALLGAAVPARHNRPKALIVDGRNNHDWRATSPILQRILTDGDLLDVSFATAPATDERMAGFEPPFSSYDVIVLNYTDFGNGSDWSANTKTAFVGAVKSGVGVVVYHAASSAFPSWLEFNRVTGLGG